MQKLYAPVEHYPYHRAASQPTCNCNHILIGTIGLYQYSGTIPKMHKCTPKEPINEQCITAMQLDWYKVILSQSIAVD